MELIIHRGLEQIGGCITELTLNIYYYDKSRNY